MSNWLKSVVLIGIPLSIVLGITHGVLWGGYDMSSFYFGAAFVLLFQWVEEVSGLD